MKVFTNNKFTGHWPVGVGAVVVADCAAEAAAILQNELNIIGLYQDIKPDDMIEIDTSVSGCVILSSGEY